MAKAKIASIPVGGSATVKAQYTIQQKDLGTEVKNTVKVSASGYEGINILSDPIKVSSGVPANQEEFNGASWDDLAGVDGDLSDLINKEVTKDVELSGIGTFKFQLVHDVAYDKTSGGKNHLVMLAKDCITDHNQKHANSNVKTIWSGSLVKTYLDTTVWNALPAELQRNIVEVKLPCFTEPYTYNSQNCPSLTYVNSKLFLPSVPEIFDGKSNVDSNYSSGSLYPKPNTGTPEGSTYKWFQVHNTNNDRIKKFSNSARVWWLRSPYYNSSIWRFCGVLNGGSLGSTGVNDTDAVAPGFCL